MRRNPSRLTLAGVSLVCVLILAACCSTSTPSLRYITIAPTSATTSAGGTQQFTAQAYYSNGSIQSGTNLVLWSSSNPAVAKITGGGLATGVSVGTVTITASASGVPSVTATLTVTQAITSIAVTPANPTVPLGTNQQFTATATLADGSTANITSTATWTSSNTAVATMDMTTIGQADVPATATVGQTSTITASQNGVSGSTTLTVGAAGPVSLTVAPIYPTTPNIAIGNEASFAATENWSDGTTGHAPSGTVVWTSGTTSTATVVAAPNSSATGLATGLAAGTSTITATEGTLTPGTATLTVVTGTTHYAYVSNFNSGSIQSYTVSTSTAPYLTPLATYPTSGTVSSEQTVIHPSGQFIYYTDGGTFVWVVKVNAATGALTSSGFTSVPAGSATSLSFIAIDPYGRFLYVSNDVDSTIYGFTINQTTGQLTAMTGSPFSANLSTPYCVIIDRSGSYLYATNNTGGTGGTGDISAYNINQTTGALTAFTSNPTIATGTGPILATLNPSGVTLYTANFDGVSTNTISAYSIGSGGALTHIGDTTVSGATSIFNVAVNPADTYLYVVDTGNPGASPATNGQVLGYNIGSGGAIGSAVSGSPFAAGLDPQAGIAIDPTGTLLAVEDSGDGTTASSAGISLYLIGSGGTLTPETPAPTGVLPLYVTFYNAP